MASLIEEAGEDSRKQSKARKIELESSECGQTQFAESRTKFAETDTIRLNLNTIERLIEVEGMGQSWSNVINCLLDRY